MRKCAVLLLLAAVLLVGCSASEPEETSLPIVTVLEDTLPVPEETIAQTEASEPAQTVPAETEPEPVAEIIQERPQVIIAGADYSKGLCDGSHYSKRLIHPGEGITVISETPFSTLYVQWDLAPMPYTIEWEGGSVSCGEYGFLHEYIRLPEAVTQMEFVLDVESSYTLADIMLLTAGSAPEGVQDWLPPCEQADILVFPTHADDDVLFFGPLIAYYSIEQELVVQTAFMVEHTFYPERGHERLNGLWEMGVRYYPILGTAPDTGTHDFYEAKAYYASSHIEQWQVEQIRRFQPLVVVGHDLNGEYGNGGHKVNAYYLVTAIEAAADPEMYPELAEQYGVWDTPKLYLHLYEENEILLDVETPLENDPQGRNLYEIAVEAFECHVSQRPYFRVSYGEHRMYDCRPFGLYRTLVGYDTAADIMENIDCAHWRGEEKSGE